MKKRFNGKRILAIALALTMLVSEVGMVQAAPADEQAVEAVSEEVEVVSDDATTEVASEEMTEVASEEATEAASEEVTEATSEEEVVISSEEELEVQEESTEVAVPTVSSLAVPGKVVLRQDHILTDDVIDKSMISWDEFQEADGYQIRFTDANGYVYANSEPNDVEVDEADMSYDDYDASSSWYDCYYDMDDLDSLYYCGFKKLDNGKYTIAYTKEKDEDGYEDYKYSVVEVGQTYAVSIRAYNSGTVTNADGTTENKTVYGEWSEPVSYTIPAEYTLEKITDVKIVERVDGSSYLTYSKGDNDDVQFEIKDSQGREYYGGYWSTGKWNSELGEYVYSDITLYPYYTGWSSQLDLDSLFSAYVYETKEGEKTPSRVEVKDAEGNFVSYVQPFQPGETYTIRVRGMLWGEDGYLTNQYSEWSEPVTYTCVDNALPEMPGQLEYDEDINRVSWTKVDNADGYEIELKDASGNWFNTTGNDEDGKLIITNLFNYSPYSNYLYLSNLRSYKLNAAGTGTEYVTDQNGNSIVATTKGTTYTIRVRAYNDNRAGKKQYSEWTAPYTYTIPVDKEAAPAVDPVKVAGVTVSKAGKVTWPAEANAVAEAEKGRYTSYEVEVKDAAGREYYENCTPVRNAENVITSYKYECQKVDETNASTVSTNVRGLSTYIMIDGVSEPLIYPATGNPVTAFNELGQTYTVRVRAIRNGKNGEWSDAVSCTVPVDPSSEGVNAKPAQVTGLWIQTTDKKDESLEISPVMRWNSIENVSRYEIEIKDSKGNLYSYSPDYANGEYLTDYLWTSSSYSYMSSLSGYYSWIKENGSALTTIKNADGTDAKTFQTGETYTIRVRAVNSYEEYDATTQSWKVVVEHEGDWSAPVTYSTSVKEPSAVTGLYYVKSDDDYYYFTYNAQMANSSLYYQIALDNQFNSASVVKDWTQINTSSDKLAISKNDSSLDPSTTYFVRVVNSKYGAPSASMEVSKYNEVLTTAAVTSFTTEAKKVYQPKNITGLKVYSEKESYYTLRFDAVLERDDRNNFEIQISPTNTENSWRTVSTNSCTLYKSDLSAGTNYVRAIAWVYQENEDGEVKKVYGQPSNVITVVNNDAMTAIGNIKFVEHYDGKYYFTYTGNLRLDEDIQIWYSDSKNFDTNKKVATTTITSKPSNVNKKIYINNMKPGKTYYVKARTKNNNPTCAADTYSAFSNAVKIKTTVPDGYVDNSVVTKNRIKLNFSNDNDNWVTGYEVQKKSTKNKKTTWTTLQRSSATSYTDKKLKADKTYTYRVRAYYFDYETNTTVDGDWSYYEAMTGWSGSLKLQAKAASKSSIKLSWTKIKGAQGYEIYRRVTSSSASQISNGMGNGYSKYKQIAKVSSSKKNYTDKKLTSGMSYEYKVRAYKTVSGKKVYIEAETSASLDFYLYTVNKVQKSNGKVTVTWNPVYTAKGYLIEKYDQASGKWSKYKTIKKAKTSSYTFPAAKNKEYGDEYRIRAYKGTEYTNAISVMVEPVLAAPTNVKAKVTNGGIKISWKAVKGADYYRVFRTTSADVVYNKDMKNYGDRYGDEVGRYVADNTKVSGYRYRDLEDMNVTSVEDKRIVYSVNGYDEVYSWGPETGVKYYYYVVAYKNRPQYNYSYDNDEVYDDDYNYATGYYQSGDSKAASATIKESKPAKTSISKISSKKKNVTITFKASKDADGYEIARSTKKKKGYKVIGTVNSPDTLKYVDKYNKKTNKIKKGKTYYYKVRAFKYNADGSKVYSKYSSVKKVKVK